MAAGAQHPESKNLGHILAHGGEAEERGGRPTPSTMYASFSHTPCDEVARLVGRSHEDTMNASSDAPLKKLTKASSSSIMDEFAKHNKNG